MAIFSQYVTGICPSTAANRGRDIRAATRRGVSTVLTVRSSARRCFLTTLFCVVILQLFLLESALSQPVRNIPRYESNGDVATTTETTTNVQPQETDSSTGELFTTAVWINDEAEWGKSTRPKRKANRFFPHLYRRWCLSRRFPPHCLKLHSNGFSSIVDVSNDLKKKSICRRIAKICKTSTA